MSELLGRLVFTCLLVLIVFVLIPYGTVDAWWEATFECGVFVLTGLWILEVLFRGSWQARKLLLLVPLILLTIYAFAQTVEFPVTWLWMAREPLRAPRMLTIDKYQTYLTARKMLALTLCLGLLLLHTSTRQRLRWLVRVIVAAALVSALFGILRQLLQSPESQVGFVLPFLFYGMGYGQFISPNAFAYLMEMAFGLLAGLLLGGAARRDRVLIYVAISIPIWAALVFSNSRGGILGLAVQFVFVIFVFVNRYATNRRLRQAEEPHKVLNFIQTSFLMRVVLIVLMLVALGLGVLWMGGEKLAAKQGQDSQTVEVVGTTRREIWKSTWMLIKQHPWTGVGFGAYFLAIPQYQVGSGGTRLEQAHNDYLDLAANGGIVAVLLGAWFVGTVIWRARPFLGSADVYRRAVALGALAGILSVGVHSLFDFGLQVTGIAVVFAALVVLATVEIPGESKVSRSP